MHSFGLIYNRSPNLGDDIQTLAARQYLPRVDHFLNRERLSEAKVPPGTKVIINGWYMHQPSYWPPAPNIDPLFIAFHARRPKPQNMLEQICDRVFSPHPVAVVRKDLREYYLQHTPIYCRDEATCQLFTDIDVPAHYSGCLTLTLPPAATPRTDDIIFTDPFGVMPGTCFRADYWYRLPASLRKSRQITHLTIRQNTTERLRVADEILNAYAGASLVVTARLHAALPCIAMGTPVVFINLGFRDYRFSGYEKILQPVNIDTFLRETRHGDIRTLASTPDEAHLHQLASALRTTCHQFIEKQ